MIRPIAAKETWSLRREVLHPARALPTALDPLDAVTEALHLGWFEAGRLVGVGSIGRNELPLEPMFVAWFVRGMAVSEGWRDRGIGGRLLIALLAYAVGCKPEGIAWAQVRLAAEAFYARHGFQRLDRIDIPSKGTRFRMRRMLNLG